MGWVKYMLPILLCLCIGARALPRVDPLVDTNVGLIKGLTSPNGDYSMFLGIPYATVDPSNPFGPSIAITSFQGTFNAFDDTAMCPQKEDITNALIGTLDCLHLNVYVPSTASSRNRYPVMVWIHGGGYRTGFAGRQESDPRFLMRHDVIVVTLNYRLGAYGFLCLDTPEIPGNQGLKDQMTALRWIKNNIEAFGGNTDKITIFGESAGASSIDLHLYYTKEDLFNNVILQSGHTLAPFAFFESDPNAPLKLAIHLGFATSNIDDALTFLKAAPTDLVIAATFETDVEFRPCVEKQFDNVEPFITSHPVVTNIPKARNVSILMGFTNNERGYLYVNDDVEAYERLNPFSGLTDLGRLFTFESDYHTEMKNIIRHFYFGDGAINADIRNQLCDFTSDVTFYHPSYRSIRKYFENGANEIYHYVFSYDGNRNYLKEKYNYTNVEGALHADEISYLFDVALFDETPTPEDQLIIDRMTALWTNFAKYSNPTPELSDLLPVEWPAITKDSTFNYLDINSIVSVQRRPYHERMAFWDLFFILNKTFQKGYTEN